MLLDTDYKKNWPKTYDQISEHVEEGKLYFTYLSDEEQRVVIEDLIIDDKDTDLSDQDTRDWLGSLIRNPSDNTAQTFAIKVYQQNKKTIDGMFYAVAERERMDRQHRLNLDHGMRVTLY